MTSNLALLPGWLEPGNPDPNLGTWAVLGIMLIIFAECGILLGFFLPGDTLLFVSGLFIASGAIDINLWLFIALVSLAAFVGNMVGFGIGWKIGPPVFSRPERQVPQARVHREVRGVLRQVRQDHRSCWPGSCRWSARWQR